MTERPDGPELGPAEEERVRRLLADARHTEPMPADVALRMENLLADLRAAPVATDQPLGSTPASAPPRPVHTGPTQTGPTHTGPAPTGPAPTRPGHTRPGHTGAPIVDLAARRRRRRAALLLGAAAAVAAGFAVPSMLPAMQADDESAGGAGGGDTAARESAASQTDGGRRPSDGSPEFAPLPESATDRSDLIAGLPRVRPDAFVRDARRLAVRVPTVGEPVGPAAEGPVDCTPPVELGEQLVLVRYAGRRAVLVYAEAEEGVWTVRLYRCGDADPLRRATIPVS